MDEDRFVLSLVTIAARRGNRFVIKPEEATEVCDKWLCLLAGVTPQELRNGTLTPRAVRKLHMAAKMLDEIPVYVGNNGRDNPQSWE